MENKFTEEEWFLIRGVPGLIGGAMAGAGKSGMFGSIKEMIVSANSFAENIKEPANDLIAALQITSENRDEAKDMMRSHQEKLMKRLKDEDITDSAGVQTMVLGDARAAMALIREKAPDQVGGFVEMCLEIARETAEAAKEGGFLGFGGEQVSEGEQSFLARLTEALG